MPRRLRYCSNVWATLRQQRYEGMAQAVNVYRLSALILFWDTSIMQVAVEHFGYFLWQIKERFIIECAGKRSTFA